MDDLTEMLTADGECGVRLVVPGAVPIGWKVEPPPWGKEGVRLKSCGETMWVFCGWNQSIFLVGLMKQDLVYTKVVCFFCFLRKGMKGNQGGLLILQNLQGTD